MDTKQFLQCVLGGEGRYCTFAVRKADKVMKQDFHSSIDELIARAEELDEDEFDVFYGLATFGPENTRKVTNVIQLGSLFLDIDCGKDKPYATQGEGLDALKKFCKQLDLPKPQLVNSGRGIHAYWFLSEPAGIDEWRVVAEKLKKACEAKKLEIDPAVTADAARVLRVPGTHNYKGDPQQVSILGSALTEAVDLHSFGDKLAIFMPSAPKVEIQGSSALMDALAGNKESSFRQIIKKTEKGEGCAQIDYIIRHQDAVNEPLWRAGLSIARFTVEGEKAAHAISSKHPGYDPDETVEKFNRIKGPYLCARFDEYNPGICQNCPNWGKIKSPISLGNRVREPGENAPVTVVGTPANQRDAEMQTYVIPAYPAPYFRGTNGGVYKKIQGDGDDEDQDVKLVHQDDFYIVRRIRDPEMKDCLLLRAHCHMDGVRDFVIPQRMLVTRDEFRKVLADEGVTILRNADEVLSYMDTWVQELRRTTKQDHARRQFGFVDDGYGFVIGPKEYYADKVADNAPTPNTAGFMHVFQAKGTLEGWKEMANFLNRPGQELYQYVMCASAGSIFMHTSPVHVLLTHIWSKGSGLGKTTAMFAAASIWGQPKGQVMLRDDTLNSKMYRSELNQNLPLFIDELTNMPGKQMSDLVYHFTGGRQKNRMETHSNALRYQGDEWKLLAISTGNTSILERIGAVKKDPDAEGQRVLEVRAEPVFDETTDKPITAQFAREVFQHYGHVGPLLVRYYLRNKEEVDKLCIDVQARLDRAAGLKAKNRFWSEGVSRVIVGGLVLKKMGLVDYDIKSLFQWCVKVIKQNKATMESNTTSCESIAAEYIQQQWANTLRIKSTEDRRGKENGNGLDQLVMPEATPRGAFTVRYETDKCRFYLLASDFKKWCIEQQINYNQLCEDMTKDLGAERVKIRMGKGTSTVTPPVTAITFVSERLGGDLEEGSGEAAPAEEG